MVDRIRRRRTAPVVDFTSIEALMKSISKSQDEIAKHSTLLKTQTVELFDEMKRAKVSAHTAGAILAQIVRPTGKASNTIDPQGFRKLVKDDKEFYGAISVSVTAAKKVLPEKQLATITKHTPAKVGEETVKVTHG